MRSHHMGDWPKGQSPCLHPILAWGWEAEEDGGRTLISDVPQDSVLGLLLFFLYKLFRSGFGKQSGTNSTYADYMNIVHLWRG